MILDQLSLVIDDLLEKFRVRAVKRRQARYPGIHGSVRLGANVRLIGPRDGFVIGPGTYINDAIISAGEGARVAIGSRCAIGYRVSIKAVTHDVNDPAPDESGRVRMVGRDITIGDSCWIGDNVFIREGVSIGDNVVIGANSVVTKSVPGNTVVCGAPASVIRCRQAAGT